MTYSQGGEEAALLALNLEPGHLLDIGAADGMTFSNSRALIERGWHAILVESSPDHFMTLFEEYRDHPRVDLVLATVGVASDLVSFHHTKDLVGTTEEAHFEKWREAATFDGAFYTWTVPLVRLLEEFWPLDVISIDTEGTSAKLCHELFDSGRLPRVIVVEHDSDATLDVRAFGLGYRAVYCDGNNIVYAR